MYSKDKRRNEGMHYLHGGQMKKVKLLFLLGVLVAVVIGCKSREEIDKTVKEQKPAQEIVIKQELERDERILTVMGNGEIEVSPDLLWAEFAVKTQASIAEEAQEQNTLKVDAVVEAIQAIGIAREDIRITEASILPVNDHDKILAQISSYEVSNIVVIKTQKVKQAGNLVSEAVKAGAEELLRLEFALVDAKKHYQEALSLAVADAYEKAHIISLASDVDIIGPLSIYENSENPRMLSQSVFPTNQEPEINSIPIQAGLILVTAQVNVEFYLKWPGVLRG